MGKKRILVAALVIVVSAAIVFLAGGLRERNLSPGPAGFVQAGLAELVGAVDGVGEPGVARVPGSQHPGAFEIGRASCRERVCLVV